MADFRFTGISNSGKSVQGVITADTMAEAKKKIKKMAAQHKVKINRIQKRKIYMYKIQKNGEKPTSGEQKAFTKEEVRQALNKLGYNIVSIQPKINFLNLKPPAADIVTFVRLSADLLREKLPFNEVLQLLGNDLNNPTLRDSIKEINNDLRQGKDSEEAFMKQEPSSRHENAFPRDCAVGLHALRKASVFRPARRFSETWKGSTGRLRSAPRGKEMKPGTGTARSNRAGTAADAAPCCW